MSDEWKESERERADRLQRAFDEAAGDLGLRLEPAAGMEPRSVGVAFIFVPFVSYPMVNVPPDVDHDDDAAIRKLIEGLESLSVQQYQDGSWKAFLNDPYVSVGHQGLGQIDQATLDTWLASPEFQEFQQEYPWKSPRDVKVQSVHIVYIGLQRANATYRVRETYANGETTAGNAAVTLIRRDDTGWRIISATKISYDES